MHVSKRAYPGLVLLLVLKVPLATVAGPDVRATVLSIGDGNTIRVLEVGKGLAIRLACIDATEMAQAPDGATARSYLQSRLRHRWASATQGSIWIPSFARPVAEPGCAGCQVMVDSEGMHWGRALSGGPC